VELVVLTYNGDLHKVKASGTDVKAELIISNPKYHMPIHDAEICPQKQFIIANTEIKDPNIRYINFATYYIYCLRTLQMVEIDARDTITRNEAWY
jgi:hypothetical protein